ncbi:MAG: glycosyltransferase family 4 protein [Verrucomicrobiales bacterium]|nr:glycosyltransferase family 4 protein [Verrucomicrobiales bacterium]
MKIGISTTMIQRGKSGVAQYVLALVRALLECPGEHRLHLLVLEEDEALFAFARDRAEVVPVPESARPPVPNIRWHQTHLPALTHRLGLDVLHVPSYRRLLWPRPCALVGTIHDLAPFHLATKYDWKRMLYGRVVVKRLARRQHEIVAVSQQTARDLHRFFGLGPDRVTVVWNGIDHGRFREGTPDADRAEAAARWGLDRPFFLYVSRLEHPAKNHVRLIEAFERFKQRTGSVWVLALAGGDWHGVEAIRAAAAASPCARDIRFLGFVDDAALPTLYRAAGVFVYPSLFEGFGLPPVEAMACGTPVISSTRGALREVVADAARTVDPEDPGDLEEALTAVAGSSAERDRLRTAGLANAARFDWSTAARETLALYERAASRVRGPVKT